MLSCDACVSNSAFICERYLSVVFACAHVCVCLLVQGLEAHARMALSLPSQSVSKSTTVASAMPGIFCAVGNAKVYCFCVVCGESHSLAQQGWCLRYHAHIYVYPLACYSLQRASSHEVLVRVQGFGVPSGVPCRQWQVRRCDHVRGVLCVLTV